MTIKEATPAQIWDEVVGAISVREFGELGHNADEYAENMPFNGPERKIIARKLKAHIKAMKSIYKI